MQKTDNKPVITNGCNLSHLTREQESQLVGFVCEKLPLIEAIYLYGSAVTEMFNSESDVDIALLIQKPLTAEDALFLKGQLELFLRRDVDLLDMRRTSVEMAFSVLKSSIKLFERDTLTVGLYETAIMSMWADLQIDRREIIEDIEKRGSVYGR